MLPLFHALAEMANLLLPLTIGARVVFLETVSSTTLLGALETRGITIFACVPQFFYLIHQRVVGEIERRGRLAHRLFRALVAANVVLRDRAGWNPGRRVFARVHHALGPRMRLLITGGSRFDPAIARDLYGLGVSLSTATASPRRPAPPRSCGRAIASRRRSASRCRASRSGSSVDRSAPAEAEGVEPSGEVLIRGPIVMREYFRRPDATAEAIRDGWLYTGDLGRLDREGRLYITGRKKEIIVLSSGKNLYPEEIEAHYRQSPFIKELCVLGLSRPGEPAAERLHAVIVPDEQVLRERGVVNFGELVRFEIEGLSVQLPAHKRILSYDISLEPLPRTTTGKLRRSEIERLARQLTDAPRGRSTARPPTNAPGWPTRRRAADTAAIATHLGRTEVPPDANLELDLGLDSMERVELLTMLETRRGRRVAPEVRVHDLHRASARRGRRTAPPASDAPAANAEGLPWDAVLAEPPDPALVDNLTRSKVIRAAVIYAALRIAAFVIGLLIGLRVTGRAHIPAAGPIIVSPNHQTYLDGFFVAAALPFHAFRRIFFVGAAEYFETPRDGMGRACDQHRAGRSRRQPRQRDARRGDGTSPRQGADALSRRRAHDRRCGEDVSQGRRDPGGAPGRAGRAGRRSTACFRSGRAAVPFNGASCFRLRRRGVRLTFGPPIRFSVHRLRGGCVGASDPSDRNDQQQDGRARRWSVAT